EFAESIFYASPMHDIGKVAIPDAIQQKPGPLNASEWEVMKTHTSVGAEILKGSNSPYLQMAVDIAEYHHERWDGKGYPKGLQGEEIPLTARIMNICDQYDALRSERPYKPAFNHEKSCAIILQGSDRTSPEHFDPEVLEAFRKCRKKFAEIYDELKV
ncbi:MAG: HD domain-containing phosphohydrolase, partial [Desulfuromonadales bacterium]